MCSSTRPTSPSLATSADEPLGKPIFDDIAQESRDFVMQLAKKRRRGEPVPPLYEETALKKDGTRFFAEVAVSSYMLKGEEYSCVILRDITDRKQAEDEARLLKHSIDVRYDGAYWIDSNARLVYVNDAACKSLGYEREEPIGKLLLDINRCGNPGGDAKSLGTNPKRGATFLVSRSIAAKTAASSPSRSSPLTSNSTDASLRAALPETSPKEKARRTAPPVPETGDRRHPRRPASPMISTISSPP